MQESSSATLNWKDAEESPSGTLIWKDPAAAASHFIGFLAAIAGLCVLVVESPPSGAKITSMAIYGGTLVTLFGASTAYHFFDLGTRGNKVLRRIDHAAIYLLIAGTALPVLVHMLDGSWRVTMIAVTWSLAGAGVLFKVAWLGCPRWLDTGLYVVLGWMILIPGPVMWARFSQEQVVWLIGGGLMYTGGAVIYALERPDPWPGRFGFHEVWHLFVLAGAGAHFGLAYSMLKIPCP